MTLKDYLAHTGKSQAEFAREVEISDQAVCDYLAGRTTFADETAARIEKITNGVVTFLELKHPKFVPKFQKASNEA